MPAQAKPCLCKPSCTKILGPRQQACHHQLLQAVLDYSSDSSNEDLISEIQQLPLAISGTNNTQIPDLIKDNDQIDQIYVDNGMDAEPTTEEEFSQSSGLSGEQSDAGLDIENEEDMSKEDETTAQDLICIFKERCDDEWQNLLHLLHKCHTFLVFLLTYSSFFQAAKSSPMKILIILVHLHFGWTPQQDYLTRLSIKCINTFSTNSTLTQST